MHIIFQNTPKQNIEEVTTSYKNVSTQKVDKRNETSLDISDIVMDNISYGVQGRTKEDVMRLANAQEIPLQRNYMAVMSNSVSKEEFASLMEEGVDVMDMEIEEAVTIVDKIKAEILKSGKTILGYTDDLDTETLQEITGSKAFAQALLHSYKEQAVPITEKNLQEGLKAMEKGMEIKEVTEGMMKYMLKNQLSPTIVHLYQAKHSGARKENEGSSFANEKIEEDFENQIRNVLKDAHFVDSPSNLEDAKWIVKENIPLTKETFSAYKALKEATFPVLEEPLSHAVASALSEGREALEANLLDPRSLYEKAIDLEKRINQGWKEDVTIKRQSTEIRLQMTLEANLKLLKSDYYIDTKNLEDIVEELKKLEISEAKSNFLNDEDAFKKQDLYIQTLKEKSEILSMPLSIIGQFSREIPILTMHEVAKTGEEGRRNFEKANKGYETFMTAPRYDLGDRFEKAFQNVEEILKDLDLPFTNENQRAIRALSYNRMDLTKENIMSVKEGDEFLQKIVRRMTPKTVLNLIKEGINPLETKLVDLDHYLENKVSTYEEDLEKYSRYLYRLEKNHEITDHEKEAYIGIYRLLHQIEKSQGAALGEVLKEGKEVEFKTLLSALRSHRVKGMDITIDDGFGGLEQLIKQGESITDQISKGYEIEYGEEKLEEFQKAIDMVAVDEESAQLCRRLSLPLTGYNLLAAHGMLDDKKSIFSLTKGFSKKQKQWMQTEIETLKEEFDTLEEAQTSYEEFVQKTKEKVEEDTFLETTTKEDLKALKLLHKQLTIINKMAVKEEYEVPILLGEEISSLHLILKHKDTETGTVFVKVHGEKEEEISARFLLNKEKVFGQIHFGKKMQKKAEKLLEDFTTLLKEEGFEIDGLSLTKMDLALEEIPKEKAEVETKKLYKLAKLFIKSVQM